MTIELTIEEIEKGIARLRGAKYISFAPHSFFLESRLDAISNARERGGVWSVSDEPPDNLPEIPGSWPKVTSDISAAWVLWKELASHDYEDKSRNRPEWIVQDVLDIDVDRPTDFTIFDLIEKLDALVICRVWWQWKTGVSLFITQDEKHEH